MIWVSGVKSSYPMSSFHSEEIWQNHLLKVMWVGARVKGKEFKKSGDGVEGGSNSSVAEENECNLHKDKENNL